MTIQELYKQFGGNYEQVSRIMKTDQLIERYICRFEESGLMERLRAAAETMDASGIFEAAHAMKGVCGNLGFDTLAEEAAALADEFRTGRERMLTDDEVCGKLRSIEALYQRTVDGIHTYMREK